MAKSRRATSLRALTASALGLVTALVVAVAVLLLVTTQLMQDSVDELVEDGRREEAARLVAVGLLGHTRASFFLQASGAPEQEAERARYRRLVQSQLHAVALLSNSPIERQEIALLRDQVAAYFALRDRLEQLPSQPEQVAHRAARPLDAALRTVDQLHARYAATLRRSETRAAELSRVGMAAAGVAVVMMLLGFAVVLRGVHRQITLPLRAVLDAIGRLEPPHVAEAPETGPIEIRTLARQLNARSAVLSAQQRCQLAFIAGVAHDLRNPLSAMKLAVETLGELTPELRARPAAAATLTRLERQIDRLGRMVNDLVDAARIQSGELELSRADHDLVASVREMVALYAPTSERHQIAVRVPDAPVLIDADPLRIDQVVSNLVSNAIKYSPDGGLVEVCVDATAHETLLTVRDRGVGIAPEEMPNLFVPFRRGIGSSTVAPGAGLGLSVTRRIVEAHGGRLEVESQPGEGSTFRVVLPRLDAARSGRP